MRISEGNSNQYLIQGIATVLVFGVLMVFFHDWLRFVFLLLMIVIAGALFTAKNGFEIDSETGRYRRYGSMATVVFGHWKRIPQVTSVILQIHADNSTVKGILPGAQFIARQASSKVITYDVLLVTPSGEEEVYSALTYKMAKKIYKTCMTELGVEGRDIVAERLAKNRAKRRR